GHAQQDLLRARDLALARGLRLGHLGGDGGGHDGLGRVIAEVLLGEERLEGGGGGGILRDTRRAEALGLGQLGWRERLGGGRRGRGGLGGRVGRRDGAHELRRDIPRAGGGGRRHGRRRGGGRRPRDRGRRRARLDERGRSLLRRLLGRGRLLGWGGLLR